MKKAVLILTIAGGILGIFSNIIFYTFGTIGAIIVSSIFKGLIPVLDLSEADAAIQKIIYTNALIASTLCVITIITGIIYFISEKNEGDKKSGKYVATIVLIAISAGMVITYSIYCLILPGIAAILALISVINDFRTGSCPEPWKIFKKMVITAIISAIILLMIYFLPEYLI